MSHILLYGDTVRSPELRHEVPVEIGDPFLYVDLDGRRVAIVWSIEGDRISSVDPTIEIVPTETFPSDDLVSTGVDFYDIEPQLAVQKARSLGLRSARVPERFPLRVADALRADGVELTVDQRLFDDRRRAKTPIELEGIRQASRAADAGLAAIAGLLARSRPGSDGREVDGQPLTCELLKEAALAAFALYGCRGDDLVVAHGAQAANGHEPGSGRVDNDDHLVCDLFPRHIESGCYSDTTRTFVVGTPPPEVVTWHAHCVEALELARSLVRPGVHGTEVYGRVCDFFEGLGYPTSRSKPKGSVLREGFNHSLGHGVGLEVHEAPFLGKTGHELAEGDVIAVEPGLYRHGFGGVRVEDLLLVTAAGCEPLTRQPLSLEPSRLVETDG